MGKEHGDGEDYLVSVAQYASLTRSIVIRIPKIENECRRRSVGMYGLLSMYKCCSSIATWIHHS